VVERLGLERHLRLADRNVFCIGAVARDIRAGVNLVSPLEPGDGGANVLDNARGILSGD